MQTENKLNRYGVRRVSQEGRRVDCVCACGTHFSTTPENFPRVMGCEACRHAAKLQWQRDNYAPHPVDMWHRKPGRPPKDESKDQCGLESLDPAAIWQRIRERHWKRESDISPIAERRKSE